MQIDIQRARLDEALSLVDDVASAQSADAAMRGQVLRRRYRPDRRPSSPPARRRVDDPGDQVIGGSKP
jgi:hypothetical protein